MSKRYGKTRKTGSNPLIQPLAQQCSPEKHINMVGDTGLEPNVVTSCREANLHCAPPAPDAESDAVADCSELRLLISAWPALPSQVRRHLIDVVVTQQSRISRKEGY